MNTKTSAFWMPFTANRKFASQPKMIEGGEGMYYTTEDGRQIIDGTAGLWCCNAGHSRPEIVEAVSSQIKKLDYAPSFQLGHPKAFELAERLVALSPATLDHVFFTNSGSESVDTALKIALAYQQLRGKGQKQRLIGREKGYHGTGFGGISVGGLGNNKRFFGTALATDHLPHTLNSENAFSRGLPEANKNQLAELEAIVALHDASTIAAVIVEPVVGSAGVIVPPQGYLKKLRELCTAHDILLIFDEVITAFGRIGSAFAAQEFEVLPDIITTAKALTSGVIPMGAVFVSNEIHETFMKGPENAIELFHGYTYSGHPVAAAAALACLDIYEKEKLFEHSKAISSHFEDAAHGLANCANVKDVRNYGLMAAIELNSGPSGVGTRAFEVFNKCFFEKDILVRVTGDVIALSPPLIASEQEITRLFSQLAEAINETA
ncbi:aspartate aminotransferase family protein [Pseudomonadales bacterium]|jgi:beta-alanine--pyruvate transaminase|nr:aspartate aminotransferase family protein [Pseudomonadales bacterium]MDC0939019.1 aspartate aminotransferase family protein [Pseudomonadales bacterium]MDC6449453.1 aspartate aminotransferase family protein [Pseudomonadales bacterium]